MKEHFQHSSETVTVKASPELLKEMEGHWSPPVRVKAVRNYDGFWEMWFKTVPEVSDAD